MKKINYLQFTAVDGEAKIGLSADTSPDVKYSFDGKNWVTWDYMEITIPNGSTMYLKGNNPKGFSEEGFKINYFMKQGKIEAHGNIMSLVYSEKCDSNSTIPNSCCFNWLFQGCDSLLTAPEMPATTLTERCYRSMFEGCESLIMAPKLPASDLQPECYKRMFFGCKKLEYVYALFEDQFHQLSTRSWLSGVRRKGLFVKSPRANWSDRGTSGIPKGWKVGTSLKFHRLPDGTFG